MRMPTSHLGCPVRRLLAMLILIVAVAVVVGLGGQASSGMNAAHTTMTENRSRIATATGNRPHNTRCESSSLFHADFMQIYKSPVISIVSLHHRHHSIILANGTVVHSNSLLIDLTNLNRLAAANNAAAPSPMDARQKRQQQKIQKPPAFADDLLSRNISFLLENLLKRYEKSHLPTHGQGTYAPCRSTFSVHIQTYFLNNRCANHRQNEYGHPQHGPGFRTRHGLFDGLLFSTALARYPFEIPRSHADAVAQHKGVIKICA